MRAELVMSGIDRLPDAVRQLEAQGHPVRDEGR